MHDSYNVTYKRIELLRTPSTARSRTPAAIVALATVRRSSITAGSHGLPKPAAYTMAATNVAATHDLAQPAFFGHANALVLLLAPLHSLPVCP